MRLVTSEYIQQWRTIVDLSSIQQLIAVAAVIHHLFILPPQGTCFLVTGRWAFLAQGTVFPNRSLIFLWFSGAVHLLPLHSQMPRNLAVLLSIG